ncbi:MAG: alpha-amylase, partial [Dictyoglomus thermophilum]
LSNGKIERIKTQDRSILAYKLELEDEKIMVVHNLNRIENTFNFNNEIKEKDILYIRNAKTERNKIILGPYSTVIVKIP